ncbi:hypothetical protein D8O27_18725 [Burkholderia mallei]|uniref:Uncharacterized protein n=2 Tax=Burkholderia mallei TaxID=13373 RepID=A0AAX1XCN7_BURML|nr:hypothetical protein BMAA1388 [Burkholderia mallei ATCC 23344]RKN94406.1 hypothetical protein D8O31_22290 [Burkholderia mallei]RKN96485.1 hypothetical protein D8O03_21695 [Burkholderia mallei]RKO02408.1 hypothetical protein D8O05_17905 [Burkholderia mallei]RKO11158.1 hypothetical protein D8O04_18555 [Burkholderia mallei]
MDRAATRHPRATAARPRSGVAGTQRGGLARPRAPTCAPAAHANPRAKMIHRRYVTRARSTGTSRHVSSMKHRARCRRAPRPDIHVTRSAHVRSACEARLAAPSDGANPCPKVARRPSVECRTMQAPAARARALQRMARAARCRPTKASGSANRRIRRLHKDGPLGS